MDMLAYSKTSLPLATCQGAVEKNLPANTEGARDEGLIPGTGRSHGEGMATHSSILAWKIPWTGDPGGLQSMGSQRVGHD